MEQANLEPQIQNPDFFFDIANWEKGMNVVHTVETVWMSIVYGVFWRLSCDIDRLHYPLEIIGFYLVRLDVLNVCTVILPVRTGKNEQSIIMRHNHLDNEQGKLITITVTTTIAGVLYLNM